MEAAFPHHTLQSGLSSMHRQAGSRGLSQPLELCVAFLSPAARKSCCSCCAASFISRTVTCGGGRGSGANNTQHAADVHAGTCRLAKLQLHLELTKCFARVWLTCSGVLLFVHPTKPEYSAVRLTLELATVSDLFVFSL